MPLWNTIGLWHFTIILPLFRAHHCQSGSAIDSYCYPSVYPGTKLAETVTGAQFSSHCLVLYLPLYITETRIPGEKILD